MYSRTLSHPLLVICVARKAHCVHGYTTRGESLLSPSFFRSPLSFLVFSLLLPFVSSPCCSPVPVPVPVPVPFGIPTLALLVRRLPFLKPLIIFSSLPAFLVRLPLPPLFPYVYVSPTSVFPSPCFPSFFTIPFPFLPSFRSSFPSIPSRKHSTNVPLPSVLADDTSTISETGDLYIRNLLFSPDRRYLTMGGE
ncbi:hypothetical protein DFH06DRAFT_123513 [Mycena polygramma]|nr:hypothetical protein DFH06DRAFT_123513 [Mycena polygramma]